MNDVHALSGAYAVDALDPAERALFEEHLDGCETCRAEVESLREAAATLADDAAVAPPAGLRDRVLAEIQTVRPLPPVTTAPASNVSVLRPRRWRPWTAATLVAAAAAVLAVVVTTTVWQPWADEEPALTAAEQVLEADDAVRASQEFPDGSRATVVLSRSEGRAVILTEDMAPAPSGKDYELWLQTPAGDMEPAGLMPDDSDATVVLDGDASEATGVGITVEPDGGSPEPSTPPIAVFDLSEA